MSYPKLPKRCFRSQLIEYANFEDGSFINIIKLKKPYANGIKYAVYGTTKSPFCSNGMYKDYKRAKEKFDLMVHNGKYESNLIETNTTVNFNEN